MCDVRCTMYEMSKFNYIQNRILNPEFWILNSVFLSLDLANNRHYE